MVSEGDDDRFFLDRQHRRLRILRPGRQIGKNGSVDPIAFGEPPQALLTMLYRSTDRRCRRGAAVKNLSHSASFHSVEKTAPSKLGIKHLVSRRRIDAGLVKAEGFAIYTGGRCGHRKGSGSCQSWPGRSCANARRPLNRKPNSANTIFHAALTFRKGNPLFFVLANFFRRCGATDCARAVRGTHTFYYVYIRRVVSALSQCRAVAWENMIKAEVGASLAPLATLASLPRSSGVEWLGNRLDRAHELCPPVAHDSPPDCMTLPRYPETIDLGGALSVVGISG